MSSSCPVHQPFHSHSLRHHADVHRQTEDCSMMASLHSHTVSPLFIRSSWYLHTEKGFSPNHKTPQGKLMFDYWFYFSTLGRFKMTFVRRKGDSRALGKADRDKLMTDWFLHNRLFWGEGSFGNCAWMRFIWAVPEAIWSPPWHRWHRTYVLRVSLQALTSTV